jgi:predicted phage gp36 major capsid-like protein
VTRNSSIGYQSSRINPNNVNEEQQGMISDASSEDTESDQDSERGGDEDSHASDDDLDDNRMMAQSVSESENDSEVSERDAVRHNTSGRLVSVGQTVKGRGATLPEIQVGVLAKRVCNSINQHGAEPYFTQF